MVEHSDIGLKRVGIEDSGAEATLANEVGLKVWRVRRMSHLPDRGPQGKQGL